MKTERPYEFRNRLEEVHKKDRRDYSVIPAENEFEIKDGWEILIDSSASEVILTAAKDLQDYFLTSMNVSLLLKKADDFSLCGDSFGKIIFTTSDDVCSEPEGKAYRISACPGKIVICGSNERGTAQGAYYLEDLMNLKEAPVLEQGEFTREAIFSPRMTHSGYELDVYPDSHLSAIAHAGMDAILVFAKDVKSVVWSVIGTFSFARSIK